MKSQTILILVPLVEEREYFLDAVRDRNGWNFSSGSFGVWSHGSFKTADRAVRIVVRTLKRMGHLEAALTLAASMPTIAPDIVILLGLAGSMDPEKVGLGDVVVSSKAKMYTVDKVASISEDMSEVPNFKFSETLPSAPSKNSVSVDLRDKVFGNSFNRYERDFVDSNGLDYVLSKIQQKIDITKTVNVDSKFIPERFRNVKSSNREREVHFGWILGSHHVVDSLEYRKYLKEKDTQKDFDVHLQLGDYDRVKWCDGDLLAVDMESFGVLKAVVSNRELAGPEGGWKNLIGAFVVRGISDLAEHKGSTDRNSRNQLRKIAVTNAAEICAQIIEKIDYTEVSRT